MSWRRLENILKMPGRSIDKSSLSSVVRLEGVLKTSWKGLKRQIYLSCSRRLEEVFWRCVTKINMFILIKMSWRRKCSLELMIMACSETFLFKASYYSQTFLFKTRKALWSCFSNVADICPVTSWKLELTIEIFWNTSRQLLAKHFLY